MKIHHVWRCRDTSWIMMTPCWSLGGQGGSWLVLGSLITLWMCLYSVNKLNFQVSWKLVMSEGVKNTLKSETFSRVSAGDSAEDSWLGLGSLIMSLMFLMVSLMFLRVSLVFMMISLMFLIEFFTLWPFYWLLSTFEGFWPTVHWSDFQTSKK